MSTALAQLDILSGAPLEPAAAVRRTPVRAHMRRVQGSPPPTGAERRDVALAKHETKGAVRIALEYVRAELRALYRSRAAVNPVSAWVNADDVDALLREWSGYPRELRKAPGHWKGTVFRGREWEQTGVSVSSTRPHMHATSLPCWRPVERP